MAPSELTTNRAVRHRAVALRPTAGTVREDSGSESDQCRYMDETLFPSHRRN